MSELSNMIVTKIDGVTVVPSPKGRSDTILSRKVYGLSFCFDEGQITYSMNGKNYVSNKNTAIILPMGGNYSLQGDRAGNFPLINFYAEGLSIEEHKIIKLRKSDSYTSDFERLHSIWKRGGGNAELFSVFYGIIARLEREESPYNRALKKSMEYLSQNIYSPDLTVEELARQANISQVYFRKIFKEAYGESPKQYIIDLRVRQAKQLLEENSITVTAVAEACGFSSVYHFCRLFKTETGYTPMEYCSFVDGETRKSLEI